MGGKWDPKKGEVSTSQEGRWKEDDVAKSQRICFPGNGIRTLKNVDLLAQNDLVITCNSVKISS